MIDRLKGNRSDYWNTPKDIYDEVIKNGYKDYNPENSYIDPFYNHCHLFINDKVFINPPFSILNKDEWLATISLLMINNNDILLLIPSRTDTKQFHKLLEWGFKVTFIKGRLKYNDTKPAPFPSLWMKYENIKYKGEIK